MKRLLFLAIALLCMAGSAHATPTLIAQWDFNSLQSGVNPATVAPSAQAFTDANSQFWMMGVSYASAGARATHYNSSTDKSSDPNAGANPNNYAAYNTNGYDATGDKSSWRHSTAGYQNISAEFDYSATSSLATDFRWVYTTNGGTTWTTWNTITTTNDGKWHDNIASLVLPSVCNNNPNFAVGVMWNSGGASTGNLRLDMLQVYGDAITTPEPGSLLALLTGCIGLIGFAGRGRRS